MLQSLLLVKSCCIVHLPLTTLMLQGLLVGLAPRSHMLLRPMLSARYPVQHPPASAPRLTPPTVLRRLMVCLTQCCNNTLSHI